MNTGPRAGDPLPLLGGLAIQFAVGHVLEESQSWLGKDDPAITSGSGAR